jgi:hypothetical protein
VSPLYLYKNKLLVVGSKLAISENCCCDVPPPTATPSPSPPPEPPSPSSEPLPP